MLHLIQARGAFLLREKPITITTYKRRFTPTSWAAIPESVVMRGGRVTSSPPLALFEAYVIVYRL